MRKNKFFALALLTFLLVFSICACGTPPPEECTAHVDENGDSKCDICDKALEPEKKPDVDEITLIEGGKAKFQIVVSKNSTNSTVKKAIDNLVKVLRDLDVEVTQVAESADNKTDCEVLIGIPTERGAAFNMDIHTLGYEGYAIKLVEGSLLIVGGSDKATVEAIEVFTEEILGIDKKTDELTTVKVKKAQCIEAPQTEFRITALKVDGVDMKDHTIAVDTTVDAAMKAAEKIQTSFYEKAGYWLKIVPLADADKSVVIRINENTYTGNGFYVDVKDGRLTFDCEFPNKLEKSVDDYLASKIVAAKGEVNFTSKTHKTSINVRDINYEEFGAISNDGKCDLVAISEAHKYANEWGHSIKAKAGAVYNIAKGNYAAKIKIKTDTNWNGCKFIFEDNLIGPHSQDREAAVFNIASDREAVIIVDEKNGVGTELFAHVTKDNPWLDEGDNITTNIGWKPGEKCLLYIESNEKKHYIRYGANANSGSNMQELILVDADGNIDPSTPLQWSYTKISKVIKYSVTDRPITVGNATVETYFNNAPSEYTYYYRNIQLTRANSTLSDVKWVITGDEGLHGAPYYGLAYVTDCYNATVKNYTFERPPQYYTDTATSQNVVMGTYGVCMFRAVNCYLIGLNQTDIRDENNVVWSKGAQGSNYCKNLYLIDSTISLFDAHCGTYNATLIDSEVVSLNMIGEGTLRLERVRLVGGDVNSHLVGGEALSIGLRQDYGATWQGTVEIIDCTIELTDRNQYNIFKSGQFANKHNFGYTCYFPTKVVIDGLKVETRYGTKRTGIILSLASSYLNSTYPDLSEKGPDVSNPYMPCEELIIKNCEGFIYRLPDTPMFKNMRVYIDGVEQLDWKTKYGLNANK